MTALIIVYVIGSIVAGAIIVKFLKPFPSISKSELIAEIIFFIIALVLSWIGLIILAVFVFFGLRSLKL